VSNLAKHGADFDDAITVFDDPRMVSVVDPRSHSETRYHAIGIVAGRILLVVNTMRGNNVRPIISARRASSRERKAYTLQAGS
jgi:uncharacterized DUF497 family protein